MSKAEDLTEIELQAGYLYEYMRAHLTHVKLVEYNPDRLQKVRQQGLDKIIQTLEQYADEVNLKFAQHLNHKKSDVYDFVKYFNTWKSNQEE